MPISTSLFHQSTTRDLSKINEGISDLQGQITSGKNDPRPSADPVRALRLSAAHEQEEALGRFASNIERAQLRLDLADTVLEEGVNTIRRVSELALRAASDSITASDRESMAIEVRELRGSLLGLANARDDLGQPLFGGYLTQGDPFRDGPTGVTYVGDGGQSRLQISETTSLATGIGGQEVWQGIGGGAGEDIFAIIDDFIAQLGAGSEPRADLITGQGALTLSPDLGRDPSDWRFTVEGPQGSAVVQFTAAQNAVSAAVDAVNAQSAVTGISASVNAQTGALELAADGAVSVSGLVSGSRAMQVTDHTRQQLELVPPDQTRSGAIEKLLASTDHLIDQRTRLGALSASATLQSDITESRQLSLTQTLSNLEDLDLAAALTKLQQSMLTRDAALQAYVKITQKNLFDYMR